MAKTFKKVLAVCVAVSALAGGLAACASQGPTDNPVARNLTWDRYVGGDDIARSCTAGGPDRYRLVYNARQDDQQKTYDLSALPGGELMLEARVIGKGNLNDPKTPLSITDPIGPWRGPQALYRLNPAEAGRFKAALTATGFEAPAPSGLFLRGDTFYWTASACRDGVFHFHAWAWPDEPFKQMAVPLIEAMAAFDKTGVEAIRPYEVPLPPYSIYLDRQGRQPGGVPHQYQVGANGLKYSQGVWFN